MDDGSRIRLVVGQSGRWSDEDRTAALVERIREAMDTYARGASEAGMVLLQRGGRDVPEWLLALRALGAGASADHRSLSISTDRLWSVVESHGAVAETRAAAAAALSTVLDEPAKKRLRAARDAVADHGLRDVLEAVVEGDEGGMLEGLDAISRRATA
jgi:hypothetical protein